MPKVKSRKGGGNPLSAWNRKRKERYEEEVGRALYGPVTLTD